MALVHTIGVSVQDFTGAKKSMALYVPAALSLATVQGDMDTFLPKLDAAIDGKIVSCEITMALSLVAGLKGAAASGNTVREGVSQRYSATSSSFVYSQYIPSWANAGFAGNVPLTTGVYATEETGLAVFGSDRDANLLIAYLSGKRAFRK
jgi:hypothetical protein